MFPSAMQWTGLLVANIRSLIWIRKRIGECADPKDTPVLILWKLQDYLSNNDYIFHPEKSNIHGQTLEENEQNGMVKISGNVLGNDECIVIWSAIIVLVDLTLVVSYEIQIASYAFGPQVELMHFFKVYSIVI